MTGAVLWPGAEGTEREADMKFLRLNQKDLVMMLKEGGEAVGEREVLSLKGTMWGQASRRRCSARGLDKRGRGKGARGHRGHPSLVVGSHAGEARMEAG